MFSKGVFWFNMNVFRRGSEIFLSFIARNFNISLRKKILLLYVSVVVIPIMILGFIAGQLVMESLRFDYRNSVVEAVEQVAENVEFRKQTYELLVTRIATDGELIARLSVSYDNFESQADTVRYIDRSFRTIHESVPGIATFRIYHNNRTLIEDGGMLWKPSERAIGDDTEEEWYQSVLLERSPMKWNAILNNADLTLVRKILFSHNECLGIVYLQLHTNQVFGQMIENSFHGQGEIYLAQNDGYIFAASKEGFTGKKIDDIASKNVVSGADSYYNTAKIDGIDKFVVSKPISSGWRVVGVLPLASIERQTRRAFFWIAVITLGLVLLSSLLVLTLLNNLVYRLHTLEKKMSAVTKGNFNVSVLRENADELGRVEKCFNIMVSRLGELIDEIALSRFREKEQTLRALQAQINPHFLYNTFGIIRWHALDANDMELCKLIDSMTIFYRLSLNKGSSIISIRDELAHVRSYIEIQQHRYPGMVDIIWDIDEKVMDYYTIKLILQPIVENCYNHGRITKKKDGVISISVQNIGNSVVFKIRDNGIGMSQETIKAILSEDSPSNGKGFGIYNIRERLKLYFGNEGRLDIDSQEGKGTMVTIAMPVCEEPPRLNWRDSNA